MPARRSSRSPRSAARTSAPGGGASRGSDSRGSASRGSAPRTSAPRAQGRNEPEPSWDDRFREVSDAVTDSLGTPWALLLSVLVVVAWALTGPLFGFSDTWQLVINTATTVITFWMVFVIQTSQNRQSKALQFKLDELIRSIPGARNRMIEAERETTKQLKAEEESFQKAAERGGSADDPPEEHRGAAEGRRKR
jgi:low affinity Fe/Cu permease